MRSGAVAKAMLPDRFSQAIDAAAMAEGSVDSVDYLQAWGWGEEIERDGDAQSVVNQLLVEFDREYPQSRLTEIVKQHRK